MEPEEIGKRIKLLREVRGLKKNTLANLAGVAPTYLNDIEAGRKCPTVAYLSYICQGLNISLSEFFAEDSVMIDVSNLREQQRILLNNFIKSL